MSVDNTYGLRDYRETFKEFQGLWQHNDTIGMEDIKVTIYIEQLLVNDYGDKQFYFTYKDREGHSIVISYTDLLNNFTKE